MAGYWWECEDCKSKLDFREATQTPSIGAFIWDKLRVSNWNQDLLLLRCIECCRQSVRITYMFPRRHEEKVRVTHIVGVLRPSDALETYLPMLWETYFVSEPDNPLFDFKYTDGRKPYGLNKPAVLARGDLRELFELYHEKTGQSLI